MGPIFEEGGYWYYLNREGQYSEPFDTEVEASVSYRQYYHNAPIPK